MKLTRERVYGWCYAYAAIRVTRADDARFAMSGNLISLLFPLPFWLAISTPRAWFWPVLVAGLGGLYWGATRGVNVLFAAHPLPGAAALISRGTARVRLALPAAGITLACLAGGLYGFYWVLALSALRQKIGAV